MQSEVESFISHDHLLQVRLTRVMREIGLPLMPTTIEIFCCYAREDQDLMKSLRKHLMPLQRRGLITIWSDTDIDAGMAWEEEIQKHLNSAHIILLLISPDFMASDYCYSTEMDQALQRNARNEARVIPVILRPTAWKGAPFDSLEMMPSNARPVTDRRSWQDADEALNDVIEHIDPIVTKLLLPLYIDEAEEHVKRGRRAEALAGYERALRLEPKYVTALYGKGAALFLSERYEESLAAYDKAIEASIELTGNIDARFYYGKASVLRKLRRYEESLQAYDESLRINPHKRRTYKDKVELLLELERYTEALEVYRQLVKVDAENAATYCLQAGDVLVKLNGYLLAYNAYEQAFQYNPDATMEERLYAKKGEILLRFKLFEEAIEAFERAIILDPLVAMYHQNKGKALLELKRFEESLAAFEKSMKLNSDADPYQFLGKGLALVGLERYDEALATFDEAIRLSGDKADSQFYHEKAVVYTLLANQAYLLEQQARNTWVFESPREDLSPRVATPRELSLSKTIMPSGSVYSVAIHPSGKFLATGSSNKIITLWNLPTRQESRTLTGHTKAIRSLAISPEGTLLASGSGDNTIKLWNLLTGQEIRTLTGHLEDIFSVAINSDGDLLASGGQDKTVKLWNLFTGQSLQTLTGHASTIYCVAFSSDGQHLASGSSDNTIKLWDILTGQELHTFTGHSETVYGVAINPDRQILASGSDDNTIKLWSLSSRQELYTLTGHLAGVYGVSISPDGRILASGSLDQTIKLWDLRTGQVLQTIQTDSKVYDVLFSLDGQFLVSIHGDNTIRVWEKKRRGWSDVLRAVTRTVEPPPPPGFFPTSTPI